MDIDTSAEQFKSRKRKRNKLIHKKIFKKSQGKCKICNEELYDLLDVHRIVPGCRGGEYRGKNVVAICTSCHRLVHTGNIQIMEWVQSSGGYLLRVLINNEEKFL